MLTVKIELWPHGDDAHSKVLMSGKITQVAKDGFHNRAYSYQFGEPEPWQGHKFMAQGLIRNWPRYDHGSTVLLARCLDDALITNFGKLPWEKTRVP